MKYLIFAGPNLSTDIKSSRIRSEFENIRPSLIYERILFLGKGSCFWDKKGTLTS